MLERQDVVDYTVSKQELQLAMEELFAERMESFNLAAFLADPRGYTRAFLGVVAQGAIAAVAKDAQAVGQALAAKAKG